MTAFRAQDGWKGSLEFKSDREHYILHLANGTHYIVVYGNGRTETRKRIPSNNSFRRSA